MDRIKVQDELVEYVHFNKSVDDIIAMLLQFKVDYDPIEYFELEIDEYSSYGDTCFRLMGNRYETDEEYTTRIKEMKERILYDEAVSKEIYERLKQKFEPNT